MTFNTVLQGDSLEVLKTLPDELVDCCVTSPPYYGLRDYGVSGQIGLEETPEKYIERLVGVFREVKRVLKDEGTFWLNIGDTYNVSSYHKDEKSSGSGKQGTNKGSYENVVERPRATNCKPKDLIGIPWMLAFALRSDGWYLRQDIIWHKPNPMPESVKDRCTKSHEYIFLLSKKPKYYFDYEAIQEDAVCKDDRRGGKAELSMTESVLTEAIPNTLAQRSFVKITDKRNKRDVWEIPEYKNLQYDGQQNHSMHERRAEGLSDVEYEKRNKRDVWSVTTQAVKEAHFATFPEKLIEPCILAGCPIGGVVLDPFFGSGTTGRVSTRLNRQYLGIELNPEYIEIANKRTDNIQMSFIGMM